MKKSDAVREKRLTTVRSMAKKERMRRRIMECARQVFYKNGYLKAGMREIAEVCGLTTGGLYHYFNNKEEILHTIVVDSMNRGHILKRFYKRLGNVSYTEAVRACIGRYLITIAREGDMILFYNREIVNVSKSDKHYLLKTQVEVVEFFEDLFKKGIAAGEFEMSSPVFVAHNILILGQTYEERRWFLKSRFSLEEYTKELADFILSSIVKKDSSRVASLKSSPNAKPAKASPKTKSRASKQKRQA